LKNIPGDHVDQVGVVVFDLNGVVAVELFNHPNSWRGFSKSIIRSYRKVLTEEVGDLIEVKTDRAKEVFARYLEKLELGRTLLTENKVSRVWDLRGTDVEGELTMIESKEIHLTLNRATKRLRTASLREPGIRFVDVEESVPEPIIQVQRPDESRQFIQKRGGYNILSELSQAPQRFTELLEKVDVSRGTLANRIREAEEIGLIEKGIRKTNGSPAYTLTEEGEKTKQTGDNKAK
jgi:hypothetical protein